MYVIYFPDILGFFEIPVDFLVFLWRRLMLLETDEAAF
jgi:hypothetical protein